MKPLTEFIFHAYLQEDNPHNPVKYSLIIFSTTTAFDKEIFYGDFYEPIVGLDLGYASGYTYEECLYKAYLILNEEFRHLYSKLHEQEGFSREIDYSKYGVW